MTKPEEITKNIIRLPIYSLLLFSVLVGVSMFFLLNEEKEKEANDYKTIILYSKKKLIQVEVKDILFSIDNDYKKLLNKEKRHIKHRIYEAQDIIKRIIKNNPNLPKKQLEYIIIQTLSAIRFKGGDGYYFVYDYETNRTLVHPVKQLLNKDMTNFKDVTGNVLVQEYKKVIEKNGEGFVNIYFIKPSETKKEYKKIVFIHYIPEFNWVIGTGFYVDDVVKEFQKEKLKEISKQKYGKNQSFFVIDAKSCKILIDPTTPKSIGKNGCNLKDIKGKYFVKEFKKVALNGGGFVSYYWKNLRTNKIDEEISYVAYYPKFNWIVGTTAPLSKINKIIDGQKEEIKEETIKFYLVFFSAFSLIFIIVLFFAYKLSKKVEKTFNIYKNDLEHRIDKAVKESIKKDKILQEQAKFAQMGEMIGMIAHQWRQPLNAIALNFQALPLMFECCENNEECEEFIKNNMKTIKFMSATIDDFRNFFKTDKEKEKFSLKDELEKVKNLVSAQLKNYNIELEIEGEDFEIIGYKNQFAQVILNLITNSKDAILENGIKEGKITIILDKKNRRIIIKDNGGGIKADDIDRIFEPYFSTKGVQGTGIGLYMSKMILRNMDANIQVKNIENGAEFIIEFSPNL